MKLLTVLALAALATAPLTGCLELPMNAEAADAPEPPRGADAHESADERSRALAPARAADGTMTAEERVEEAESVEPGFPPFTVTRTITVSGILTLRELPVLLQTENGDVDVTAGADGEWELVATLRARGATPADARASLDTLDFSWSHRSADGYFLQAAAGRSDPTDDVVPLVDADVPSPASARFELTVPAGLLLDLVADTTNGDVSAVGVSARALYLDTTNGDVDVKGVRAGAVSADSTNGDVTLKGVTATDVDLDTTNGAIDAEITPARSGRIRADTTNADVTLRVPEGPRFGYAATLDTTNGRAEVKLEDGASTREDGDEDEVAFRSSGFDGRAIQVVVELDSTNGDVTLRPL